MTVNAVGKNDSLSTVVKSTAVGAAAGYSLKYVWRINKQESDISPRRFINLGRKIANEAQIDKIAALKETSPAQDCFVKMAQSKDKRTFAFDNISKKVKALGGEDSGAGKELRSLVRDANNSANQISRRLYSAYRIMLKNKRPAVPFLVAGAGAGFIAGIMRNVMRNDV